MGGFFFSDGVALLFSTGHIDRGLTTAAYSGWRLSLQRQVVAMLLT
jgi:hypothetical protein